MKQEMSGWRESVLCLSYSLLPLCPASCRIPSHLGIVVNCMMTCCPKGNLTSQTAAAELLVWVTQEAGMHRYIVLTCSQTLGEMWDRAIASSTFGESQGKENIGIKNKKRLIVKLFYM